MRLHYCCPPVRLVRQSIIVAISKGTEFCANPVFVRSRLLNLSFWKKDRWPPMTVKIVPNENGNPPGKLADAELHFDAQDGLLNGLKLIGFGVWERRSGNGRNVTFPSRSYAVNGERRSFALLRPMADNKAQDGIREAILQAYAAYTDGQGAPAQSANALVNANFHTF